ncbi:SGNH/GDSL hydrolase family protein [Candidatus Poribacteria bacterium]
MIKVMPLGDSITAGVEFINGKSTCENGGYRTHLWEKARAGDLMIDFIGSRSDGPSHIARGHEGHPGWTTSGLLENIDRWLGEYEPQVILLMTGINDLIRDRGPVTATQRLNDLVQRIFHIQSEVCLIVASVPPLKWSMSRGQLDPLVMRYNSEIPHIVEAYASSGSSVYFLDVYNALAEEHLLGTHPSPSGYRKIAEIWYPSLKELVAELESR